MSDPTALMQNFTIHEVPSKDFIRFRRAVAAHLINEKNKFFPALTKKRGRTLPLVLGGFIDDIPIAVVVAFHYPDIHQAFIQTLFVKEEISASPRGD